ncbi:MAG: hypothetical protein HWQ38_02765 [Nostoc sp. NMS7]|uniref:hypothetical protein n=1 Tax=Nostoc sp. NMS7 TaxID=2815391 RepID=UPI0025EA587B|nr:hypothetical protein [Nostoc sp. NMS7]MBN3945460.1 hypothetical protein [Nostoc sp. NMS7]
MHDSLDSSGYYSESCHSPIIRVPIAVPGWRGFPGGWSLPISLATVRSPLCPPHVAGRSPV